MLFILVVDECHYGPTRNGIPILHDERLQGCYNFLVLLVSATPFNCLSNKTRIKEENRVVWSDVLSASEHVTTYIGFEYYARSIAFRLKADYELHMKLKTLDSSGQDCENHVIISLQDLKWREFASYDTFCDAVSVTIKQQLEHTDWSVAFKYIKSNSLQSTIKLVVAPTRRIYSSSLEFVENDKFKSLLNDLGFKGFSLPRAFTKDEEIVGKSNDIHVDDEFSVFSQHFRSESAFLSKKKLLEGKFESLKNTRASKVKTLDPEYRGKLFPLHDFHIIEPCATVMEIRNGFSLVLDYVLSLAYFATCRSGQTIDETTAESYLSFVRDACYFADRKKTGSSLELCNLLPMVEYLILDMIKTHEAELNQTEKSPLEVLVSILTAKRDAELKSRGTSENQTWFTESDRIVNLLLEQTPRPMVLLRVYDNDQNLCFQRILRHALEVYKQYYNERLQDENERLCNPPFSVIGDISTTNLYESLEPHYRNEFIIEHDVYGKCTIQQLAKLKGNNKMRADLKYEDLEGIPCLLILCEKGRFGDTFPHNLRVLDMRLRTAQHGTGVIQEVGRMCRYPKVKRGDGTEGTMDISDNEESIRRGCEALDCDKGKFRNGVMIRDGLSDQLLGYADIKAQLRFVIEWSKSATQSTAWKLLELKYPLPYSLIDESTMQMIRLGLEKREVDIPMEIVKNIKEVETYRNKNRVLSCIAFRSLDDYLKSGNGKKTTQSLQDFALKDKGKPGENHYDFENTLENYHQRRILLSAECQIGKTGCFLALLQRFAMHIRIGDPTASLVPPIIIKSHNTSWLDYLAPYWHDMHKQPTFDYAAPNSGKYINAIATQRFNCLLISAKLALSSTLLDGINLDVFNKSFRELVYKYEYLSSKSGRDRLENLLMKSSLLCPFRVNGDRLVAFDQSSLLLYLDWDGRTNADGIASKIYEEFSKQGMLIDNISKEVDATVRAVWDHAESNQVPVSLQQSHDQIEQETSLLPVMVETFEPEYRIMDKFDGNPRTIGAVSVAASTITGSMLYTLDAATCTTLRNTERNPKHGKFCGSFRVHVPEELLRLFAKGVVRMTLDQLFAAMCEWFKSRQMDTDIIKRWMFTISYQGKFGKDYMYLYRKKTFPDMIIWEDYVQLLVVRDNQFDDYREYFGRDYIIISLPKKLEIVIEGKEEPQLYHFDPDSGGCGYARLFVQQFAEFANLDAIWMIDDNVAACYKLEFSGLLNSTATVAPSTSKEAGNSNHADGKLAFANCTFKDVIIHIEAVFDSNGLSIPSSNAV